MVGGGDDWDEIEAEGQAARAAAAAPKATSGAPASASYGGGDFSMDDDPFADAAGGALELDLPAQHQRSKPPSVAAPSAPSIPAAPPSLQPPVVPSAPPASNQPPRSTPPLSPSESAAPASGPRSIQPRYPSTSADPSALIARFPSPPEKVLETPGYALRVLWRQMELRQDLASLRRRRSPDVPLFERALRTYDPKTFTLGLLLSGAIFAVVTFVVFLPVIFRYASN